MHRDSSPRLLRRLKNFQHGLVQDCDHPPHLLRRRAIRRHQHDDVADGPRQHAALRHRFANADARAFAQIKRLARPPVFDQFDADAIKPTCRMSPTFGSDHKLFNSSRRVSSSFAARGWIFRSAKFPDWPAPPPRRVDCRCNCGRGKSFELVDIRRGRRRRLLCVVSVAAIGR